MKRTYEEIRDRLAALLIDLPDEYEVLVYISDTKNHKHDLIGSGCPACALEELNAMHDENIFGHNDPLNDLDERSIKH